MILEVKGLQVRYRDDERIYSYPPIVIERGKCLCIMGSTGCGKTTFLNSLFSLRSNYVFVYQRANLLGKDIFSYGKDLYKIISYAPQFSQSSLNPSITVMEHIRDVKSQLKSKDQDEDYNLLLKSLKLDPNILSKFPHQLSGGMKQRLVILLGFLKKPQLFVFDEPSTAIDPITLSIVLDFLKEKKEEGVSMLMVSHDLGFVRHIGDQVIVLGGRSLDEGAATIREG